jgi:hypothetical protein
MTSKKKDRDYLKDTAGRYWKIIGDYHPEGQTVSYVKYYPSEFGHKRIGKTSYSINTHVATSFPLILDEPDRTCFSKFHGNIVTCTPDTKIANYFDARLKLETIWENPVSYASHPIGKELVQFVNGLDAASIRHLGVTGSFLIDAYDENSDIDLVCYGREGIEVIRKLFSEKVKPYEGQDLIRLYKRRMNHMQPMDFKLFGVQENRKFQGMMGEGKTHINCQPVRAEENAFENMTLMDVGEIECTARVLKHEEGIFAPAIYEIEVIDVLNSLFPNSHEFLHKLRYFISYIGGYANSFRTGDRVYLKGGLARVLSKETGTVLYGIELTPWHTSTFHRASLLSMESDE